MVWRFWTRCSKSPTAPSRNPTPVGSWPPPSHQTNARPVRQQRQPGGRHGVRRTVQHLHHLPYITVSQQRCNESIGYMVEGRDVSQREHRVFAQLMNGTHLARRHRSARLRRPAGCTRLLRALEILVTSGSSTASLRAYCTHNRAITTCQHTGDVAGRSMASPQNADMAAARHDLRIAGMARLDEAAPAAQITAATITR